MGDASKGRSSEPCSGCYRASAVAILREIHEVADRRQSAKQLLTPSHVQPLFPAEGGALAKWSVAPAFLESVQGWPASPRPSPAKLFGGLSEAYAFVDLAQKAYGTRLVASATGLA